MPGSWPGPARRPQRGADDSATFRSLSERFTFPDEEVSLGEGARAADVAHAGQSEPRLLSRCPACALLVLPQPHWPLGGTPSPSRSPHPLPAPWSQGGSCRRGWACAPPCLSPGQASRQNRLFPYLSLRLSYAGTVTAQPSEP